MQQDVKLRAYSVLLLAKSTETFSEGGELARDIDFSWVISGHHSMCLQLPSNTPTKSWWGLTLGIFCLGWSHLLHDKCDHSVILVSPLRGREDTFLLHVCAVHLLHSWVCKTKKTALLYWQGSWSIDFKPCSGFIECQSLIWVHLSFTSFSTL